MEALPALALSLAFLTYYRNRKRWTHIQWCFAHSILCSACNKNISLFRIWTTAAMKKYLALQQWWYLARHACILRSRYIELSLLLGGRRKKLSPGDISWDAQKCMERESASIAGDDPWTAYMYALTISVDKTEYAVCVCKLLFGIRYTPIMPCVNTNARIYPEVSGKHPSLNLGMSHKMVTWEVVLVYKLLDFVPDN